MAKTIHIESLEKDISAGAVEAEVGKFLVPEGEVWIVHEIAFGMVGAGKLHGYVRGKKIIDLHQTIMPGPDARVLQELELGVGDDYSFTATDYSGATNKTNVLLIIEKKPAS